MKISSMLNSTGTERVSVSKLVMLVGLLTATGIVAYQTYTGTLSENFFLWYIASTFGANTLNKAISVTGSVMSGKVHDKAAEVVESVTSKVDEKVTEKFDEATSRVDEAASKVTESISSKVNEVIGIDPKLYSDNIDLIIKS